VVAEEFPPTAPARRRWKRAYTAGIVVTLVILALAEAAIIARLVTLPTIVSVAAPVLPVSPQPPALDTRVETDAVIPAVDTVTKPAPDRDAGLIALAAARQQSGGIRWSSAIELNVFEGDRVLGSTADGPIVATAGTHELDLVNTALGYRTRQTVTIRPGVITPLTLTPPMGRININAQPWAQVLIDDSPIGETPLANISVPLGQHQVTFRHPEMGERRETVTVRADTITRVTTSFER
jgi:hypothetical protein